MAKRLKEAALENQELRAESARLQHQNNRLQGYALDDAGAEQLSELIGSLTQVGFQCSSIWGAAWTSYNFADSWYAAGQGELLLCQASLPC